MSDQQSRHDALQPFLEKRHADTIDYSKRRAQGMLSAWQRVDLLMDRGSLTEIAPLARERELAGDTKSGATPRDGIVPI